MPEAYNMIVAAYFDNLARIANFIKEMAGRAQLNSKDAYAAQMAVDEACTNIIEHAYGSEGDDVIEIHCHIQPDGLKIAIYDQGDPFDPDQIQLLDPQTPLDERKQGGMGMFFIHNLMDAVEYRQDTPEGNKLILFKQRR